MELLPVWEVKGRSSVIGVTCLIFIIIYIANKKLSCVEDKKLLQIYNPFKDRDSSHLFPDNPNAKFLASIKHVLEDIKTLFEVYNNTNIAHQKILFSRHIVIEWISLYDLIIKMNQLIFEDKSLDKDNEIIKKYNSYTKSASSILKKYKDIRNSISAHRDHKNNLEMFKIQEKIDEINLDELKDSLNCACKYFNSIKDLDIFEWTTVKYTKEGEKILHIYSPGLGFLD